VTTLQKAWLRSLAELGQGGQGAQAVASLIIFYEFFKSD
jgi:hypothetical protein